ncbi:hypothetical protein TSOC_004392 [Tetrabaena socialis]|uniref:AB hydrolase-1 domain-containing protein n=1 Tax=Tetrabaena socialis TaxID=47790 RepID=A0A2J8A997_9CHLO|nr:hypothetical protein TSOC_004392 [Tetrabaena socialis]|eukprot:PNH09053.1 hypothetical protein TSOC_004392 [Tetrabaena socialis]
MDRGCHILDAGEQPTESSPSESESHQHHRSPQQQQQSTSAAPMLSDAACRQQSASNAHVDSVASKLFDEQEGHLGLLQGGHLLSQWFSGLGPHQLRASHLQQLLEEANGASPCIRSWAARLLTWMHAEPSEHDAAGLATAAPPHPAAADFAAAAAVAAAAAATDPTDEDVRLLAPSADPLQASYRPLVFYLITEAVAAATHVALLLAGFRAQPTPNGTATVYAWRPTAAATVAATATAAAVPTTAVPVPGEEEQVPLVFLHGIGLGLAPYLRLLGRLVVASGGRRAVYAVQYKHVSMRLTARIPAPHEVATDVAAFLMAEGATRVSVFAHSYGTLIASALNKLTAASAAAPTISRLTLVDPVCFAMFLPHLVRNTIYQQPVEQSAAQQAAAAAAPVAAAAAGGLAGGIVRKLLKGLVVAEFHCSVALRRRLDWAKVNLWPSELPAGSTVVLSGRDNLVPVQEVRHILAKRASMVGPEGAPTVLYHEALGHGGFLMDEAWQAQVLAAALGTSVAHVQDALAAAAAAKAAAAATRAAPPATAAAPAAAATAVPQQPAAAAVVPPSFANLPPRPRAAAAAAAARSRRHQLAAATLSLLMLLLAAAPAGVLVLDAASLSAGIAGAAWEWDEKAGRLMSAAATAAAVAAGGACSAKGGGSLSRLEVLFITLIALLWQQQQQPQPAAITALASSPSPPPPPRFQLLQRRRRQVRAAGCCGCTAPPFFTVGDAPPGTLGSPRRRGSSTSTSSARSPTAACCAAAAAASRPLPVQALAPPPRSDRLASPPRPPSAALRFAYRESAPRLPVLAPIKPLPAASQGARRQSRVAARTPR